MASFLTKQTFMKIRLFGLVLLCCALTSWSAPKLYAVQIQSGSLNKALKTLSIQFGWTLKWQVPSDYAWTGKVTIKGHNLPEILQTLLKDFPVQANFYQGNRVLVVSPRALN